MQNVNDKICAVGRLCPHDPAECPIRNAIVAIRLRGSIVFIFSGWGGREVITCLGRTVFRMRRCPSDRSVSVGQEVYLFGAADVSPLSSWSVFPNFRDTNNR